MSPELEQKVNYTLEMDGNFIIIENVPARLCVETGEHFFSPETVERLQQSSGKENSQVARWKSLFMSLCS
jgi:YgiT-type zinc finger domain-containing protein